MCLSAQDSSSPSSSPHRASPPCHLLPPPPRRTRLSQTLWGHGLLPAGQRGWRVPPRILTPPRPEAGSGSHRPANDAPPLPRLVAKPRCEEPCGTAQRGDRSPSLPPPLPLAGLGPSSQTQQQQQPPLHLRRRRGSQQLPVPRGHQTPPQALARPPLLGSARYSLLARQLLQVPPPFSRRLRLRPPERSLAPTPGSPQRLQPAPGGSCRLPAAGANPLPRAERGRDPPPMSGLR